MRSDKNNASGGGTPSSPTPAEQSPQQAEVDLPEDAVLRGRQRDRESCFGRRLLGGPDELSMKGRWGRCVRFFGRLDFTWTCTEIRDVKLDGETLRKMKRTFWLSRIVFLRLLAFVYFFAFLSAYNQNQGLIGSKGISPAADVVKEAKQHFADLRGWERVKEFPSLFLLLPATDFWLSAVPFLGMLTSAGIFIAGAANAGCLLILWLFYQSLISVGQQWYFFGWESQLLETGFLAIWLSPFWSCSRFPLSWPTPKICVWGSRWLLFRVMLGAGLIQLRQDDTWKSLTALNYYFETQPLPSPFSWYFHQHAPWLHGAEAIVCIVMRCVVPFLVLIPRRQCRLIGGVSIIAFQLIAGLSSNASFLNLLTIVPAVMCLDDHFLTGLFPVKTLERMPQATQGCAGEWSCPLRQGWPFDQEKRKEVAEVDAESQALLGEDARTEETSFHSDVDAEPRSCFCWYWPSFLRLVKHLRMPKGTIDAATRHVQERWWKILSEVMIAAAIIACMLRLSEPGTYAVWEVISVFFLVLLQAAFSAFVNQTKASYIFTEVILSLSTLISFTNLFAYGPEVWSVWLTSCLIAVLSIFSYSTLRNAALVTKVHVELLMLTLIIVLSIPVIENLVSPQQLSHASFEPFQIVNTYGVSGKVQKERYELIIQGTDDINLGNNTKWQDYEFHCKPTNTRGRPCIATPYHYRLDWLMGFVPAEKKDLAMKRHKWFPRFLHELLKNNSSVTSLLRRNPFAEKDPPAHVRVLISQYRFTSSSDYGPLSRGPWWKILKGTTQVYMSPEEVPGSLSHLEHIVKERQKRQEQEAAKEQAAEEARRRLEEEEELKRRLEAAKRAAEEVQKQQAEAERKRKEEEERRKREEEERRKAQEEEERQRKKNEEENEAARKRKEEEKEAARKAQEAKAKAEAERLAKEQAEKEKAAKKAAKEQAEKEAKRAEEERQRQAEEQRKRAEEEQKAREAQQQEEKRRHDLEAQEAMKRQEEEKRHDEEEKRLKKEAEERAKKEAEKEARRQERLRIVRELRKHKIGGVPLREAVRLSKKIHLRKDTGAATAPH